MKSETPEQIADEIYESIRSAFHWGDGHTSAHNEAVGLIRAAIEAERESCIVAIEARFKEEERNLEEKHVLHGCPKQGIGQRQTMPLIAKSADIAACRLMAVAAIRSRTERSDL